MSVDANADGDADGDADVDAEGSRIVHPYFVEAN